MARVVIIGMMNPHSDSTSRALWPAPVNSTGWRLWQLLHKRNGATVSDFVRTFERHNLLPNGEWTQATSRAAATRMISSLRGATVLLLGAAVRDAFRLPPVRIRPIESRGVVFRQLPHPSGRCRWYNEPRHRRIAGLLLEDLYKEAREWKSR